MTITKPCRECGTEFAYEDPEASESDSMFMKAIRSFQRTLCDPCADKELAEKERAHEAYLNQQQIERWNAICPPMYRGTDVSHPGLLADFRDAALGWKLQSRGLGFMGNSGGGKTRLMFMALRKAFNLGAACQFLTHNQFSKLVIDAFSGEMKGEQRKRLDFLGKVQVLFIDDLGKAPSTERTDAELEELIEIRGSNLLPTLWTANGHGEWLIKRFGPDRGDALVRRLAEFSTVVKA